MSSTINTKEVNLLYYKDYKFTPLAEWNTKRTILDRIKSYFIEKKKTPLMKWYIRWFQIPVYKGYYQFIHNKITLGKTIYYKHCLN